MMLSSLRSSLPSWSSLSSRDRRAVTVGALAFAPMLLWLVVVGPYLRHLNGVRERLATGRDLLARELRMVAAAPQYASARERAARQLDDAQRRLVYATTDAAASATLSGYVAEQARAAGVEVSTLESSPDTTAVASLRGVSVRLVGTSDVEGILTLLGTLERGALLLAVRKIDIEAVGGSLGPARSAVADRSAAPGDTLVKAPRTASEALTIRLTVTGFRALAERRVASPRAINRVAAR